MGQYFVVANHDRKELLSIGKVGAGFVKMQEWIANDDFARLLAFVMADGRADGGAVRSSWAGDRIQIIGDYRTDATEAKEAPRLTTPDYRAVSKQYTDVTRKLVEQFNAYAGWWGDPPVSYYPGEGEGVPGRPEKGMAYYPTGRVRIVQSRFVEEKGKRRFVRKESVLDPPFKAPENSYIVGVMPSPPGTPLKAVPEKREFYCEKCRSGEAADAMRPDLILSAAKPASLPGG